MRERYSITGGWSGPGMRSNALITVCRQSGPSTGTGSIPAESFRNSLIPAVPGVNTSSIPPAVRKVLGTIDRLPIIVVHELVHAQQRFRGRWTIVSKFETFTIYRLDS